MKKKIYITHSAHLDLFWMDSMEHCMESGSVIIDEAVEDLSTHPDKYFVVESVRFLEYYLHKYPGKKELTENLIRKGQLEVGACYTDRLENHHDGESLVRNVIYGKKLLKELVDYDSKIAAHPDLPGLTEQTPQIYKKAGVEYYLFARGYHDGGRFKWKGLDGSTIIAYNYPIHYTYYDFDELMQNIDKVEAAIQSETVLLSCSAGDLGDYNTFVNGRNEHVDLQKMLDEYNQKNQSYQLVLGNVYQTLAQMGQSELTINEGESPCRWGTYGSATNVTLFRQDKIVSALLLDAEKLMALCRMNQTDISKLQIEHPFGKIISSHPTRKYFDQIIKPESLNDWIAFAWRLQMITQDHNYGGVEGLTSDFDRTVYKKCAKEIAEKIIAFCMQKIAGEVDGDHKTVVVNTLNWDRAGKVEISQVLESAKHYAAVDSAGNKLPIGHIDGRFYFEPMIPALGYESFHIIDKTKTEENASVSSFVISDTILIMKNAYYEITIDKINGGITSILDRNQNTKLLGNMPLGILRAYEDFSVDVHEEIYHKKEIDHTQKKFKSIAWGEDDLCIWAKLETEICDSKVEINIRLGRENREIEFTPVIYWIGMEHVQLRMNLSLNREFKNIYYGVPYGIQKFGNYMKGAYPANPLDEISDALFEEYREIQGWFAVEDDNRGISISTMQSSFAFKEDNDIEAVLIRNVKSCGDHDVIIPNHGKQQFEFHISSYQETSVENDDSMYKKSWELQHPLYQTVQESGQVKKYPGGGRLLEASQEGIMSVLNAEGNTGTGRFFSVTEKPSELFIKHKGHCLELTTVDFMGQPTNEDRCLSQGQIKTVAFNIDSGNSNK